MSERLATEPKVLFVADLNVYSKGLSRLRALRGIGAHVEALSHTAIGGEDNGHAPLSPAFKLAWKLGLHLDTEGVNKAMLKAAEGFPAELIWIEKGNMIRPATLAKLRALRPRAVIASYSEDDMFNPLNRTRAYSAGLRHHDVVFVTKSFNADPGELPSLGARRCVMVDKAYDPDQHHPLILTDAELDELSADAGFIGSYAPERGAALRFLAENGVAVRVWGNGWQQFTGAHPNLRVECRPLVNVPNDLRYTKGVRATRVNLGFLRKLNRDLQTDRSVEIPACGGFMLAEQSDEHARLFEDGREAVFFQGFSEMLEKTRFYLDHEDERQAIAAAGYRRCVDGGYSHAERMRFMLAAASDTPS